MYRRSRSPITPLRLLGGLVIVMASVVAFTVYQQANRIAAPSPTVAPPTNPAIAASASATPQTAQGASPVRLRIVSPKASLSTTITPLYITPDGQNWDLTYLDNFAGHLEGTPEIGQGGNFVLAGHVELKDGRPGPFANVGKLVVGDEIMIYSETPDQPFLVRYKVTEVKSVEPTDIAVMRNRGYEELTLITCADWDQPSEQYLTRVIVHAKPY
jgi:LPXTG-site transpeptidase (sortase) family protein